MCSTTPLYCLLARHGFSDIPHSLRSQAQNGEARCLLTSEAEPWWPVRCQAAGQPDGQVRSRVEPSVFVAPIGAAEQRVCSGPPPTGESVRHRLQADQFRPGQARLKKSLNQTIVSSSLPLCLFLLISRERSTPPHRGTDIAPCMLYCCTALTTLQCFPCVQGDAGLQLVLHGRPFRSVCHGLRRFIAQSHKTACRRVFVCHAAPTREVQPVGRGPAALRSRPQRGPRRGAEHDQSSC